MKRFISIVMAMTGMFLKHRRSGAHESVRPRPAVSARGWLRRRRPPVRGLTIVLVAALVAVLGLNPINPATAHADICIGIYGVPFQCGGGNGGGGGLVSPFNPPPPLLDPTTLLATDDPYFATDAEFASLQNFEQQAVINTATNHGLPVTEAVGVQTWARDDAEAELYGLLVQAATASPCTSGQTPGQGCRTTDQQNAAQWLEDMARRQGMVQARKAGLEYVKWAGLNQTAYNNDVNAYNADQKAGTDTSTDKTNLENLLNKGFSSPADYSCADGTTSCINTTSLTTAQQTATNGFCVYRSPVPYQTDYQGNIFSGTDQSVPAICEEPGGGIGCTIDCNPDTPAYEDFTKWGEADANYDLLNNFNYTETAHDIALGIGLGGVAASVATGITLSVSLAGVMAETAFTATVFPSAGFATGLSAATLAGTSTATGTADATVAAATAGSVGASGVGAIVGGILLFITGTTLESIQIAQDSQLPGKLATLIENSPTQSYSAQDMVNDSNGGAGELYSLFVNATQPSPLINCSGTLTQTDSQGRPAACLNPPPPPAQDAQYDPVFSVSKNGGSSASQSTITWYDKVSQVTTTARLHETWFINQATDNQGHSLQVTDNDGQLRSEVQTLRILYTDWNNDDQSAWLVRLSTGSYKFVTVTQQASGTVLNPATCLANNTCAYSDGIDYVDSSGDKYRATVIPSPAPAVSQLTVNTSPTEGSPATLSVDATSPTNSALAYSWEIEDKPLGAAHLTCLNFLTDQTIDCHSVTETGNPLLYIFPTSGFFHITVTVSDANGLSTTSATTVNVVDVPPQLSIPQTCPPLLICLPGTTNTFVEPLGHATELDGSLVHAGSEDDESVHIDWGDNSSDDFSNTGPANTNASFFPARQSTGSGSISLPFGATHTYQSQGTYTVTLKATDQSSATTTKMLTETVLYPTTTSLSPASGSSVWGQPVTFTATIHSNGSGNPGGTVEFTDGPSDISLCSAQPVSTGTEQATCTTSALSVTPHNITANYSGDGTFQASTSSAVTQSVSQAATTTGLDSSVKPSVFGQSVTFTATISVTSPGAGSPGGTVEFKDGSSDISGCSARPVSTEQATCMTSALSVASHSITAIYSGGGNFIASTSSAFSQSVNKAISSTTVGTSASPSTQGSSVTFTAGVAPVAPGAGVPGGTVTFKDGSTSLGTKTLASGSTSFSTSGLGAGTHSITAVYGGDGNFNTSTSPPITQYINTNLSSFPKLPSGAYNLSNANLSGGSFVGDILTGASLIGTNLNNAVFMNANLTGANLSNSNLKGANFTNVNLTGANLTSANLKGATGLKTATVTSVVWSKATCPDGTLSNQNVGSTCVGHL